MPENFDLEEGLKQDVIIRVDLTLESHDMMGYSFHMGYKSTEFIQKMLIQYPSLYTLTIILKEFLHERGLLNAYQGTLWRFIQQIFRWNKLILFGNYDSCNITKVW